MGVAAVLALMVGGFGCASAAGDELIVHDVAGHAGAVDAAYRLDGPVSGRGALDAEWTDVLGRIVERRHLPLDLAGAAEVRFSFDARRAVTVKNKIAVRISLDETDSDGVSAHHEREATASFIVSPTGNPWSDYQIIMWQPQNSAAIVALKRLGITAGMVGSDHNDAPGDYVTDQVNALLEADLGWYLENIATDFYSPYHRWSPDHPVNWRFLEAKQRYWANPDDLTAFMREPSLSDPEWLDKINSRVSGNVSALRRYAPLFYNLADESGIADLSAFWDFDFSPASLAGMREWLKTRYRDLAQLNDEWGSTFRSWDDVMPMTTQDTLKRTDQNFAPWADFKEWMDVAFARAIKSGSEAVHAADPRALSAIEGAQIPGWGGYDYSHLADGMDAMEVYDYGDNVEMLRSFSPNTVMLTTSFHGGAAEAHRVWRELLRGTRGIILWDESNQFVGKDGNVGDRGREAAPYFQEIRNGLGALLINSRRHTDPIGIIYSPASMRIEWLLDHKGEAWSQRNASAEYEDDAIRISVGNYARAIEHMGLQHRFVSVDQVERGDLMSAGYRVLILPRTIALSFRAADAIRDFVAKGGLAIADGEPAIFDGHGRRLAKPALAEVFAGLTSVATMRSGASKGRAIYFRAPDRHDPKAARALSAVFAAAGVDPLFSLTRNDGVRTDDAETYLFDNGGVRIVALLRDIDRPGGALAANSAEPVVLQLPHRYQVFDLRARRALGPTDRLELKLGSASPIVLALSAAPTPDLSISGPGSAQLGETAEFHIAPQGDVAAALDVVHIEVSDPEGDRVSHYSGNLLAREGKASFAIPLALNDKIGNWHIRVGSPLVGNIATADIAVSPQ